MHCLTITLLIGASAIAPSILALGYANYSNRGNLLVRTGLVVTSWCCRCR